MNLSFFIARRYFLSKKKKNFINIISIISMVAVAFGTSALVIVLSVFNGLEDFVRALYSSFDPELKIEAAQGKSFEADQEFLDKIQSVSGIDVITQVVEDNAYARYRDSEMIVKLKGVSENFIDQNRMAPTIVHGELRLEEDGINYAILGRGVQYELNIPPENDFYSIQLYYPKKGRVSSINPANLVNRKSIMPGAVFAIEKQYDINYVFAPLDFVVDLFDYGNRRTSLEIKTKSGYSITEVKNNLKEVLGEEFRVLDSDEQHSSILKVLKIEKLFVFLTFSFIIAVASFNIFFCLSMLAIDKKNDIAILYSMGATSKFIRSVFIKEGAIISFSGAIIGLALGLLVGWVQQTFGLVSMGMVTSVMEAYPVKMVFTDFLYTALIIIIITLLASLRPATIATRYNDWTHL
ncbi:MAG: FtsX-like permease family protein [Candidatus Cyclobacteriaceae bacterium M3_2C_046]